MLYGPNTNNGSIIYMIECQVDYVMQLLDAHGRARPRVDRREARRDGRVQRRRCKETLAGVEVWQAGCNGYYRVASGRIVTQWPHSMSEYRARTEQPDLDAFETA